MSEDDSDGEIFAEVAARLGMSNVNLFALCQRAGLPIFDFGENFRARTLSISQVQIIEQTLLVEKQQNGSRKDAKKKQHAKDFKKRPIKKAQDDETKIINLARFSEYYDLTLEALEQLCLDNEIQFHSHTQPLSKKGREKLRSLIVESHNNLNDDGSIPTIGFIPITTVKAKKTQTNKPFVAKATQKRISVIAREAGCTEDEIMSVIKELRIPIIEDRKMKIEIKYESEVLLALEVLKCFSSKDLEDPRGIKIKILAGHYQVSAVALLKFCADNKIPTKYKRYVNVQGLLRIGIELSSPSVLKELQNPKSTSAQSEELKTQVIPPPMPKTSSTDYSGIELSDQSFEGYSFKGSLMNDVNLTRSVLVNADLSDVTAISGTFSRCKAHKATFQSSNVSKSRFDYAALSHTCFVNAICTQTIFTNADLTGTDFSHADLTGADLRWADLTSAVFHQTIWIDGRLINSTDEIEIQN